jgi:hypothetical protein
MRRARKGALQVTELIRLAWSVAPAALSALLELLRAANRGESGDEVRRRAEKLGHLLAFEAAMKAARRG